MNGSGKVLKRLLWAGALVWLCAAGPARAELLAYEGFDYPEGIDISGRSGGSGWASAWGYGSDWPGTVAAPGLASGNLATAGNALSTLGAAPTSGNPAFIWRDLAPNSLGTPGTTLYLSFLFRPDADYGVYGGVNFGGIFVGKSGAPGSTTYGMEGNLGDITHSPVPVVEGETVLIVLRADYREGADLLDLYVNPPLSGLPAAADATKSNHDAGTWSTLVVNNAGHYTTDEIRIGTAYADVVPTAAVPLPPAVLLFASGLAALVAGRICLRG
jgi:hypothetical protein